MNFFCGDCAPVVAVKATTTIRTTMLERLIENLAFHAGGMTVSSGAARPATFYAARPRCAYRIDARLTAIRHTLYGQPSYQSWLLAANKWARATLFAWPSVWRKAWVIQF